MRRACAARRRDGQIPVSERVAAAVEEIAALEPIGEVQLKEPARFAVGSRSVWKGGMTADQAMREVAGDIPMHRVGRPEELAELVAIIVEGKTGFLTAGHVVLDGGASAYPL